MAGVLNTPPVGRRRNHWM